MAMWLDDFREAFIAATLDLLWQHWTTLGVLGGGAEAHAWLLDPEALIAGTMRFGRYDPRLFDAVLDWLTVNGNWISSTRLQRMQKKMLLEDQRVLSAVAGVLIETVGSVKWKGLRSREVTEEDSGSPVPLFLRRDDMPLPRGRHEDQVFRGFGFVRPPWQRRELATPASARKPEALRIRLRGLFGITSRSEILLFLLTHPRAHPSLVARQVHYAQPPVAKAMAELATSGLIAERRIGREREYGLDTPAWLRFLSLDEIPRWANWALVFRSLGEICQGTRALQSKRLSPAILGSELWQRAQEAASLLHRSEVEFTFRGSPQGEPERYPGIFLRDMKHLFDRLGARFNLPSSTQD